MYKTPYLTDYPPERYQALLEPLVKLRTGDMSDLLDKIRSETKDMDKMSDEYLILKRRYEKVEKGIKWWIGLLHEDEIIQEV